MGTGSEKVLEIFVSICEVLSFKGALCCGQINVPTENVCYCFDELTAPDVFHLLVFNYCLALSSRY